MMSKKQAKKYFQDLLSVTNEEAERLAEDYIELAKKQEV